MAPSPANANHDTPLTLEELENSTRNGKKKLYWTAFEVVLATTSTDASNGSPATLETRYDAYQVNHNQLKKLHGQSARSVRVECKYCRSPRFTQSITVSTKKFEEHYMTLHALDALASANAAKAMSGKTSNATEPDATTRAKRGRPSSAPTTASTPKRTRTRGRGSEEDEQVSAMDRAEAAAAAVVALSAGPSASEAQQSSQGDEPVLLHSADSDTKRVKKSYWTAYDVVITETVVDPETQARDVKVTRHDAWKVNHSALRRLHLESTNDTSVRVECRLCASPKFSQSITVSTKKFEHHLQDDHGETRHLQDEDDKSAVSLTASTGVTTTMNGGSQPPRRRRPWRKLLQEHAEASMGFAGQSTKQPTARVQRASEALFQWVVQDQQAASVVESEAFRVFAQTLDRRYVVPAKETLKNELHERFTAIKREIHGLIHANVVSGTKCTLSLDQGTSFVSVTAHFVSPQWRSQRLLLACRPVVSSMDSEEHEHVLRDVMEEFGLTDSVLAVVTSLKDAKWTDLSLPHVVCAAQTLERVVTAGLSSVSDLLTRARRYVLRVNKGDVSDDDESELPMDTPSQWLTTVEMLTAIVAHSKRHPNGGLSTQDQTLLFSLTRALAPPARVTHDLITTEYPSIPMVFQLMRFLHDALEAGSEPIQTLMLMELQNARKTMLPSEALMAYALDPRFRLLQLSPAEQRRVRSAFATALEEDSSTTTTTTESTTTKDKPVNDKPEEDDGEDTEDEDEPLPSTRRTTSLFEELSSASSVTKGTTNTTVAAAKTSTLTELDKYLAMENEAFDVDVLGWWRAHTTEFPHLSRVARQWLSLVGTSVSASALLTSEGQRQRVMRSLLPSDTLEATRVLQAFDEDTRWVTNGAEASPREATSNTTTAVEPSESASTRSGAIDDIVV